MLLFLASGITNRLRYTVDLMLREMLGLEVELTTSVDQFRLHQGPKIAYSADLFPDALNIEPSGLLFEEGIRQLGVKTTWFDSVPVLFQTESPGFPLPYDPFSAAFFMVSRYEEYLPYMKDTYGRFPVTASAAWEGRFLEIPVVHHWTNMVGKLLLRQFPLLQIRQREYRFVPTIDVDHAFCYRCRPLLRTLGGIGRSLMYFELTGILHRLQVLARIRKDPYDTFDYISEIHEKYGVKPLYFMLFADYGGDDNNVTTGSKTFHRLIRKLDLHQGVGIHPSLSSNKHYLKLQSECDGLSEVVERNIVNSRQHFLKISIPRTYRALNQVGIRDDYSMGYSSQPGFRAGISIPYPFFDISRNILTSLMIHPVIMMDVTLKDKLRLNPEKGLEKAASLIRTVKSVNGDFVSLWHNESLTDKGRWLGWRRVFEEMVHLAST
ncbi:MAG: polysaccharide deacetylase family protein [Bacteroidota bacterium]